MPLLRACFATPELQVFTETGEVAEFCYSPCALSSENQQKTGSGGYRGSH